MSKYLTKFDTLAEYNQAVEDETLNCPNVSLIAETNGVKFLQSNPPIGIGIKALVEGVKGYYTLDEWNALCPLVTDLPTEKTTDYVRKQAANLGAVTYYKWSDTSSAYATTTEIQPVGAYVKQGAEVGFAIHGTINTSVKWSNNTSVVVTGVTTTTKQADALLDYKGVDNTDAVLNAVELGTIADAPLFTWARGLSFACGSEGYVPAMGELNLIKLNLDQINGCRTALGQTSIVFASKYLWTSTQYSAITAWLWNSTVWGHDLKYRSTYGVAVCAL